MRVAKRLIVWGMAFAAFAASATRVSLEQAERAVGRWLQETPTLGMKVGTRVAGGRTCSPTNHATFHLVKLDGGGVVVVSSETTREPVVAFTDDDDIVESDANPLWALLKKDLAVRAVAAPSSSQGASFQSVAVPTTSMSPQERKWAKLLSAASFQSVSSVSDVRVAPFVKSKWGQSTAKGANCWNYYTPSNFVCGCVATAGAQMMRYFEWPKTAVSPESYPCTVVYRGVTNEVDLSMQGGIFDWTLMPLEPASETSLSLAQRQAMGKLTSDIGIITGMWYASGGSGTGGYMLQFAFQKFGYSNVMNYLKPFDLSGTADMQNALLSNFDARLPVMLAIEGMSGGHAIVGDGYGYSDNTLYLHLNYGWSGSGNAWYAPPGLSAGGYNFSVLDGFVYNVYTNQTAGSVICSGRVLTQGGAPLAGATVKATYSKTSRTATTDANGIYALCLPVGSRKLSYALSVAYGDSTASDRVEVQACQSPDLAARNSGYYGQYYVAEDRVTPYPVPKVGNVWGKDLILPVVATSTTDVPVPFEWLDRHFPGTHSVADYETMAQADSDGDGFPTWQEYVLDTDPNDPASALIASIRLVGETPVLEWNHTNTMIEALGYRYVPKGRVSLADGDWISPLQSMHRFFKVFIEKK